MPPRPFSRTPTVYLRAFLYTLSTLVKLPLWALLYLLPSLRPHARWSYRQAVRNRLTRAWLHTFSLLRVPTPILLGPAPNFVTVAPASDPAVYADLLADPEIQPGLTGGTWYPCAPPSPAAAAAQSDHSPSPAPTPPELTILHFHGGAHTMSQGRSPDTDFAGAVLSAELGARVFCPSYRLASNRDGAFPAALQDAVTHYAALRARGIPARRIVLSGDSAGAGLAVSLLRYIHERGGDDDDDDDEAGGRLAAPGAALLWSPWVQISASAEHAYITASRNYGSDYLPANYTAWGAEGYVPEGMDPEGPYFAGLEHAFATPTPLWVQVGGVEILRDEGLRFAEVMRGVGCRVDVHVEEDASHDIILAGNLTGFEEAARSAARGARAWAEGLGMEGE